MEQKSMAVKNGRPKKRPEGMYPMINQLDVRAEAKGLIRWKRTWRSLALLGSLLCLTWGGILGEGEKNTSGVGALAQNPSSRELGSIAAVGQEELRPLPYRHPGLTVDLGVGLWAWPIPVDADGDGDYDLIVSCPDKPSNGIWLFENRTGDTARQPLPIFQPARRLSATRHYVMPSYVDGQLRVLTPGVEYTDFARVGLESPRPLPIEANFYQPIGTQPKGPRIRHQQWRYVDYDGDGRLDLVSAIEDWSEYGWDDAWSPAGIWQNGSLHGFLFLHRNEGTTAEPVYAAPQQLKTIEGPPIDLFGCPSPNFHDFDGDGDLDLLTGEFLDGFTYFENVGSRTRPSYRAGRRLREASGAPLVMELQMIVPIAFDWDRDGDADLIVGDEDGRVAWIENTGRLDKDRTPIFARPVYFQQEAETLKSGALATPVGVDWDEDGDIDLLSGNTAGYLEFFENLSGPGVEHPRWAPPRRLEVEGSAGRPFRVQAGPNGSIQGPAEAKWGYTTLNVADWDGDGRLDIVYNSILGRVEWLRNIGKRGSPRLAPPQPIEVEWEAAAPLLAWGWLRPQGKALLTQWRTTPGLGDLNADGLVDLVMLDTEGYLAFFERTRIDGQLRLKAPRRAFVDEEGRPIRLTSGVGGRSGRRKLCLTDWDGDGRLDLLLNSSNADWIRQIDSRNGQWIMRASGTLATRNIEGHDVSPTTVDFNGDGIPDFVGGAEDGRLYYLRNPRGR
jgi:hypothetical protein